MQKLNLQAELNAITPEIAQMDSASQDVVKKLLNIIEHLAGALQASESDRQNLRNENNILKDE